MKPYERNIVPKQIDTTTKPIEAEIVRLLSEMEGLSAESVEYKAHLDAVLRLTETLPKKEGKKLSPDAILGAATNLIGIGAVLHHEKLNVITSKAFGWIRRS